MDDLEIPCADCPPGPEHYGPTTSGTTDKPWDGSASRFSDDQYKMATAACDAGDGTVKQRCFLPHHEPTGTINVNGVHAAAQRVSSLKGHDPAAVTSAKAHLRAHYAKLKEDPPTSIAASAEAQAMMAEIEAIIAGWGEDMDPTLAAQFAGLHESYTGTHSHPHSAYGQQGGDQTHEHSHAHDGDNLHRHSHADAAVTDPVTAGGRRPPMSGGFRLDPAADQEGWWDNVMDGMAFITAGAHGGSDPMRGAKWAIKQHTDGWHVLTAGGAPWSVTGTYSGALDAIARQLADSGDTRPVLDQTWRSEMAFEGVSTGDGRYIEPGAIEYRACPMPLRLQTETEAGHMGAVLAGAITAAGKIGQVSVGTGDFDATDAGRQFVQIILARGRFGVSIDVAEADGQPQCATHGTDLSDCGMDCDWEVHFSLIRVMGVTGTPFPAFEDAYIELATQPAQATAPVAASATDETTTAGMPTSGTRFVMFDDAGGNSGAEYETGGALTAAADGVLPPADWFTFPVPETGDPRLVRQPNGDYAVPFTIEPPDPEHGGLRRCYGHVAPKNTCHTGYAGKCITPPMSQTGYAAFNLRPIPTADGTLVRVGHLTMGCGHATTDPRTPIKNVRDHYDGGPGAVRMAHVTAGHDGNGPWVAGYVEPSASDEQIATFASCSLSGDWREVWRGKGLDLVACLAGVTVPGFPVAALAAAGYTLPVGAAPVGEMRIGWRDDQPVALVASGVVRQPMPWERHIASLENSLAETRDQLAQLARLVGPLKPLVSQALRARITGEVFADPTKQDKVVAQSLQKLLADVHDTIAAQEADPDNMTDPDDAEVRTHLKDLLAALNAAIVAQSRDGQEDVPVQQIQAAATEPEPVPVPA